MRNQKDQFIPCFLCGAKIQIRYTKREKPYFICDPCGLQVFVRCKPGIKRLNHLLNRYEDGLDASREHEESVHRFLQLMSRLTELEGQLSSVEESQSLRVLLFGDSDKEQAARILSQEVMRVKKELRELGSTI